LRFGVNGKGLGVRVVGAGLGMWVSGEVWLMSKCFKLFVHALEALRCIAKEKRERALPKRRERESIAKEKREREHSQACCRGTVACCSGL
jgi:hypothetical protein